MSDPRRIALLLRPAFALLGAVLLGTGIWQAVAGEAATEPTIVQIREPETDLRVSIEPTQPSFRVGEPLRFTVQGNRRFYLYLYSLDARSGRALLLLPNRQQKTSLIEAGRSEQVPGKGIEFVAGQAGTESFVMLASLRPLDVKLENLTRRGDFWSVEQRAWERELEAKGIRIRDPEPTPPDTGRDKPGTGRDKPATGTVVREFSVRIVGAEAAPAPEPPRAGTETGAAVFVTTARERYAAGERVGIVYGADRAGWVHVYTIEPDGKRSLLTRARVDGRGLQRATARAEAPVGRHTLLAVYSPDEHLDEGRLPRPDADAATSGKGLRLESGDGLPYGLHRFWIDE